MDASTISSAINALKFSKDAITTLLTMRIETEAKEKITHILERLTETQTSLLSIQELLFKFQDENRELRDRILKNERWDEIISKYSLVETEGGAVVFSYSGNPHHYACPSCSNKKEIHPLQDQNVFGGNFECTGCGATFIVKRMGGRGGSVEIVRG